ncbi:hypothetical protein N182_35080 [Sinorhizobium sp. GL2]|nr:hypothetical protein N182_35080 [Sinorhizobium sp. GL2]
MKSLVTALIALISLLALANSTLAASSREEFRGRWSRDCGKGQTCHLDIDDMKSGKAVEITFSVEGKGEACSWSVDAVYDKGFGGPVAHDPYGNYYFYLTIQEDGRLYSSGTMLPNCGPQPTDQYFTSDAQALIDYRSVYDHNGSEMDVDPAKGTIMYREPKRSVSGTVKLGTLLFKADEPWDIYDDKAVVRGTAYVFKKGCAPAPYPVSGHHDGWHTLVLRGPAPIREKNGCKVIGYKKTGNSTLKFVSLGD